MYFYSHTLVVGIQNGHFPVLFGHSATSKKKGQAKNSVLYSTIQQPAWKEADGIVLIEAFIHSLKIAQIQTGHGVVCYFVSS